MDLLNVVGLISLSLVCMYSSFVMFQLGLIEGKIESKENYFSLGFYIWGLAGAAALRLLADVFNIATF